MSQTKQINHNPLPTVIKKAVLKKNKCRSILQGEHRIRVSGIAPLMAAALITLSSLPTGAQSIPYDEMVDLGTPSNQYFSNEAAAYALSADGSVVAGYYGWAFYKYFTSHAFRWTEADGIVNLGTLRDDNRGNSTAYALSADGSVVAGRAESDASPPSGWFLPAYSRAFRWTEAGGMEDLGTLRADNSGHSSARALSADGSVVAGGAYNDAGSSHAFRWTEAGGMVDLGTLRVDNSGWSIAYALSADGSVVAGEADNDAGEKNHAFRWTETGGMVDLGTLRVDNSGWSIAYALSADGSVVAGEADNDAGSSHAFRWTEAGGMVDLGTLRADNSGWSIARALSADGSVVAGGAYNDAGSSHAFRWTEAGGMVDLGTLRTDNSGQSVAYALSADGSIVAGKASSDYGGPRAFIYHSIMQDYDNLLASFPLLANDADVAAVLQQQDMASILDQTCFVARKGGVCLSIGGRFSYTGLDTEHDLGSRTGATGMLSLGYGADETITLGGTAALSLTDLDHSGFDMETGYGFGVWGEYSQDGTSRTGWQISAVVGWGAQDTKITRGNGLDNVEPVDGSSDLSTLSGRLSLGYGFSSPDEWVLTPRASVTAYRTRLDAYEEKEGDFTADYDRLEVNTTTATLDMTVTKRIGNGSKLILGAGLDYDLHADRATLEGTSNLFGMKTFTVNSSLDRNDLRPFALAAYSFRVTENSSLTTSAGVQSPVFGNSPRTDAGLRYCVRF